MINIHSEQIPTLNSTEEEVVSKLIADAMMKVLASVRPAVREAAAIAAHATATATCAEVVAAESGKPFGDAVRGLAVMTAVLADES